MARRRRSLLGKEGSPGLSPVGAFTPDAPTGEDAPAGPAGFPSSLPTPGQEDAPTEKIGRRHPAGSPDPTLSWGSHELELDPSAFEDLSVEAPAPPPAYGAAWGEIPDEEEGLFADAEGDDWVSQEPEEDRDWADETEEVGTPARAGWLEEPTPRQGWETAPEPEPTPGFSSEHRWGRGTPAPAAYSGAAPGFDGADEASSSWDAPDQRWETEEQEPSWIAHDEQPAWIDSAQADEEPSWERGVPAPAHYSGDAPGFGDEEEAIAAWDDPDDALPSWVEQPADPAPYGRAGWERAASSPPGFGADEEEEIAAWDDPDDGAPDYLEEAHSAGPSRVMESDYLSSGSAHSDTTDTSWDGSVWGEKKPAPRLESRTPGFFDSDFGGESVIGVNQPPALPKYLSTSTPAPTHSPRQKPKESAKPVMIALIAGGTFAVVLVLVAVGLWYAGILPPAAPVTPPAPVEAVAPPAQPEEVAAPAEAPPAVPVAPPVEEVVVVEKPAPAPPPTAPPGTLQIRSNRRVLVSVNGEPVGYPPLNLKRPPGEYVITAEMQGRTGAKERKDVRLDSGEVEPIRLTF
ncbi:MAG: hypothetical protein JXX28_17175 [Deltaproteobacteria bacterium]|nr:hypothetical protein [Deltaproteobacteria bacterium]